MKFTKMQGCGNDYVYVDGAKERIPAQEKPEIVKRLSDRHFGIGGDGVIFINPAEEADFEMEMYNADGSRAEMCGNGIRCVGKYVYDKGLTDKQHISVVSCGKIKYLDLIVEGPGGEDEEGCREEADKTARGTVSKVRVNMGSPVLDPEQIPVICGCGRMPAGLDKVNGPGSAYMSDTADIPDKAEMSGAVNVPIAVDGREYRMTCVSMGNPHAVIFMDHVADLPLEQIGPEFENHECFPNRTNTEFVEILDKKNVFMRVWERGTGETLACGTGCCAVAVAGVLNGLTDEKITVKLLGGELQIEWDRKENLVFMTGPAATVFEGELCL